MQDLAVPKERRYVGVKETVLYGVANGGQVIGYNLVRGQLTFYLVTVFGIPSAAVTLMVFVLGLWDAFNDPLMAASWTAHAPATASCARICCSSPFP